jgi:hypothetical protein
MGGPRTANRDVFCTHCGAVNTVPQRAMSVFCVHCQKRLILEDLVIRSYQALSSYVTCGDVIVEKAGRVRATIQANNLTVHGIVEGEVQTRGRVEIAASGSLVGAVHAPALRVADGARLVGYCEIRPDGAQAAPSPAAAKPASSAKATAAAKPATAKAASTPPAPPEVPAVKTRRRSTTPAPAKPPAASPPTPPAVKPISTRRRRPSTGQGP